MTRCNHLYTQLRKQSAAAVACRNGNTMSRAFIYLSISHQAVILRVAPKLKGLLPRFQLLIIYINLSMHMHQCIIQQVQATGSVAGYWVSSVHHSVAKTHQPSASAAARLELGEVVR